MLSSVLICQRSSSPGLNPKESAQFLLHLQAQEAAEPMFPLSDWVRVIPNLKRWKCSPMCAPYSSAETQLFSSVLFSPRLHLPGDANRFDEVLPGKKKELRQKMAARPDHNLRPSQGNLTCKTFLPKNTEQERDLGQWVGRKTADHFVAAPATTRGCVRHVCACLYIVSPGKCHARGWVRGGRLWVGCG